MFASEWFHYFCCAPCMYRGFIALWEAVQNITSTWAYFSVHTRVFIQIYIYIYTHTHSNIYLYINKFTYYMWLYNLIHRRQFSFWFPEGLTASCHAYPSLVWTITSTCSLNKVVTQGSYKMTLSLLLFWQIYSVQKTQQPNNAKSNNPLGKTSGLWD